MNLRISVSQFFTRCCLHLHHTSAGIRCFVLQCLKHNINVSVYSHVGSDQPTKLFVMTQASTLWYFFLCTSFKHFSQCSKLLDFPDLAIVVSLLPFRSLILLPPALLSVCCYYVLPSVLRLPLLLT